MERYLELHKFFHVDILNKAHLSSYLVPDKTHLKRFQDGSLENRAGDLRIIYHSSNEAIILVVLHVLDRIWEKRVEINFGNVKGQENPEPFN